jgi:hypothetical protein
MEDSDGRYPETMGTAIEEADRGTRAVGKKTARRRKLLAAVCVAALVAALLWLYVFPWVLRFLPENF